MYVISTEDLEISLWTPGSKAWQSNEFVLLNSLLHTADNLYKR